MPDIDIRGNLELVKQYIKKIKIKIQKKIKLSSSNLSHSPTEHGEILSHG